MIKNIRKLYAIHSRPHLPPPPIASRAPNTTALLSGHSRDPSPPEPTVCDAAPCPSKPKARGSPNRSFGGIEMKKVKRENGGLPCVARSWSIRAARAIAAAPPLLRVRSDTGSYDSREVESDQPILPSHRVVI